MASNSYDDFLDEPSIFDDGEFLEDSDLELFLFENPECENCLFQYEISLRRKYRDIRGPLTYAEATAPDD